MTLSKLLEGVSVIKMLQTLYGKMVVTQEVEVHGIQYDSRRVERDDLFVAMRGTAADGHRFIDQAVAAGATVVVLEDDNALSDSFFVHTGVVKVVVPDARQALAVLAANFYRRPSAALRLVGVTGTNGKTTTTHLIRSILQAAGERVGMIGTIGYTIGDVILPATHTTPGSLELNQLLARMVAGGCTSAVMEVSSHSLSLQRVHGLDFRVGVFTNLTQDHLDFHGTMEAYLGAKRMLFDGLGVSSRAVLNNDDTFADRIAANTRAAKLTYGISSGADVVARDVRLTVSGTTFRVHHSGAATTVTSSLIGRFNVSNILASYAAGLALNVPEQNIVEGIQALRTVRGRFEQIASPLGWTAIVDYAHTPDALENCLHTIHDILPAKDRGRIITVFGCGGDRDRGKRPLMGRIAASLSDVVVLTSDNPRSEDPRLIMDDVLKGIEKRGGLITEVDRHKAIRVALEQARRGDVVLVAGKGHETYQVVGTERRHFDDREEIELFIRENA